MGSSPTRSRPADSPRIIRGRDPATTRTARNAGAETAYQRREKARMYDKEKELFAAFAAKKMSRREMLDRARQAGLSIAAASVLLNSAATRALAADFDWMKFKGNKLKLLLNKHPYADAM